MQVILPLKTTKQTKNKTKKTWEASLANTLEGEVLENELIHFLQAQIEQFPKLWARIQEWDI